MFGSQFPMFVLWGPELRMLYNDAYVPILGARHPASLGQRFAEVWSDQWALAQPMIEHARRGEPIYHQDLPTAVLRDGVPQQAWFTFSYSALRDDQGQVEGLFCVVHETTGQVQIERQLRDSEAQLRAITNSIEQMIWSTLPDGFHDYYNDRWYEYTGVPYGSTDGEGWNDMFHPDDRDRAWSTWRRSLETGEPYRIEYRLRHRTGQYRWVLGRAQPVRDAEGRITRWFGTCTDIQDIVDARDVLSRSREELTREVAARTAERDRIWQVSRDLLGVADTQGIWRSVNPAWTRVLGWQPEEILGRTSEWLEHPDDREKTRAEVAHLAAGRTTLSFENRFRTREGGYRILAWTAVPLEGSLYCVARDVTEEHEKTEALRLTEAQLRQAQKMEAVGQLTGGIAHDFNNMLQGITSALHLIETRLQEGRIDDIQRLVETARRGAQRAAAITHRLLAFSRRQPLAPRPLSVNDLVLSMQDLMRRSVGESVHLALALAPALWPVKCDGNQLENSILNLCINARDAMSGGGSISIVTANETLDESRAALLHELDPGDYVSLAITDTGSGMPADVVARAFEPFFTTKPIGQGTGLGLSMIYGFLHQSGGHATIDSSPGRGTTVRLYLPRFRGEIPVEEVPSHTPQPPRSIGREVILLVEDDEDGRTLLVDTLTGLGYLVLEACDGPEALRVLKDAGRVDLMVSDVGLPGLNGRQVADAARVDRPDLKVLFMTGYAESAARQEGLLGEGMEMVTKPIPLAQLTQRIRALLDRR